MVEVKRKEGESSANLIFRFSKRMRQSGVVKEVRKRRFQDRPKNKRKRRLSAQYRDQKKAEVLRSRRMGIM